jgi:voltage-gated potassium channel
VPVEPTIQQRALLRLVSALVALVCLLTIGTAGYHWLEDMPILEALYMTIITVSTVGFGEVRTLDGPGRIFTMVLIVGGGGIAAYSLSAAAEFFLSGEWRTHLEQRRQYQMLNKLNNHTIVCGYGRMGRHVVDELRAQHMPFVVIELDSEKVQQISQLGYPALHGNASNEEHLSAARIEHAQSLVATASTDAENVFIVLTARSMRPDITIVSRANEDGSEEKLRRAGATRVLLPYRISGRRVVTLLVRPDVADFLDEVMHASDLELLVDQIMLASESELVGQSLQEAGLRSKFGVTVLACHMPGKYLDTSPSADTMLRAGAQLIVLGTREQLQQLSQVASLGDKQKGSTYKANPPAADTQE